MNEIKQLYAAIRNIVAAATVGGKPAAGQVFDFEVFLPTFEDVRTRVESDSGDLWRWTTISRTGASVLETNAAGPLEEHDFVVRVRQAVGHPDADRGTAVLGDTEQDFQEAAEEIRIGLSPSSDSVPTSARVVPRKSLESVRDAWIQEPATLTYDLRNEGGIVVHYAEIGVKIRTRRGFCNP